MSGWPRSDTAMADARRAAIKALGQVQSLTWITPRDLRAQTLALREAVASGRDAVAPWEYERVANGAIVEQLRQARELIPRDPGIPAVLRRKLAEKVDAAIATTVATTGDDDDAFLNWALGRYGPQDERVLNAARREIGRSAPGTDNDKRYTAEDLKALFDHALADAGLDGWTVSCEAHLVPTMSVQPLHRRFKIRADARFGAADARRLLVHELGTHAFRAVNSQNQAEPLAQVAFGDAVGTEEGLAAWNEQRLGVASQEIVRLYAARVVAVDVARTGGVVQVARSLEPALGPAGAAQVAIRVKRGLRDPNRPGAFGKDQEYLAGLIAVARHLANEPHELGLLMATKWPLSDLPLVREFVAEGLLSQDGRLPSASLLEAMPVPDGTRADVGDGVSSTGWRPEPWRDVLDAVADRTFGQGSSLSPERSVGHGKTTADPSGEEDTERVVDPGRGGVDR